MICGKSSIIQGIGNNSMELELLSEHIQLDSMYLGRVTIPCKVYDSNIELETMHNGVHVVIIDAGTCNITKNEANDFTIEQLLQLPTAEVDVKENKMENRAGIDCMFNVCNFLDFLQEEFNIKSINNKNEIIAIINVSGLDNAYWNGHYMVFGAGKTMFSPLTSPDVTAHELSHGLIEEVCALRYQGESGALNESMADCIAVAFEFWLYNKYNNDENVMNDITGEPDFFIGEDITKKGAKKLRNMMNPNECAQPMRFRGRYWVDPQKSYDHGGVHVNSGVSNHLFYLLCKSISIKESIALFVRVLHRLSPRSTFRDFARLLNALVYVEDSKALKRCLNRVGL